MDEVIEIIRASFPREPLPVRFFWRDGVRPDAGDIPAELENRLAMRPWDQVAIDDWRMIGAPVVGRNYLHPAAYQYYLPSLLIGGLQHNGAFIEYGLEAILPDGWRRRTTDRWWQDFVAGLSTEQRAAIYAYVRGVRAHLWDFIGPSNQQFVVEAETLWMARDADRAVT